MTGDDQIDALAHMVFVTSVTLQRRLRFLGPRWLFHNEWRSMFTLRGGADYCRRTRFHGVTLAEAKCFLHRREDDGTPQSAQATLILLGFGVSLCLFWTTEYVRVTPTPTPASE